LPASEIPEVFRDQEYMVLKYDTSSVRDGLFTSGRMTQQQSKWHVNNDGWISDIDYLPKDERQKPLIAVIGDSYIEGLFVEWKDHLASGLKEGLNFEYDVYAYGISGAVMSHYILVSEYLEAKFQPDIVIYFINQKDILTSIERYASRGRNMQLRCVDETFFEIPPSVQSRSKLKQLLLYPAITRYFFLNANLNLMNAGLVDAATNVSTLTEAEELEKEHLVNEAAVYIVKRMKNRLPNSRLIFVVDGNREALYDSPDEMPERIDSSVPLERACRLEGCDFLDLNETFYNDYQEHHRLFNFKHNYHWDEYGNALIAKTLLPIISEPEVPDTLSNL